MLVTRPNPRGSISVARGPYNSPYRTLSFLFITEFHLRIAFNLTHDRTSTSTVFILRRIHHSDLLPIAAYHITLAGNVTHPAETCSIPLDNISWYLQEFFLVLAHTRLTRDDGSAECAQEASPTTASSCQDHPVYESSIR